MLRRRNLVLLSACLAHLLAACLCCLRAADTGTDEAAARQQWMLGYLKVEQAANARREQHLALARQLYTEALALFREVGRRYPDWNPELVSFRTTDCVAQLRRLEEAVTATLDTMSRAELVEEVRRLRETRQDTEAQAQSLAMKVEKMESDLQTAVDQRQQLHADVARLTAEATQSRQHEADLQTRLDAVSADLKAREADLARLQAAAGDTAALQTSLADLGRQAASAAAAQQEAAAARAQVAELGAQRRQDAARVEALVAEVDRRRRELEALRAERDGLLRAGRETKEQVAQAEQARRLAAEETQALRTQLADLRLQGDADAKRAQAAEERLRTAAQDLDTRTAEAAALREELRELRAVDVTRLRQDHAAALARVGDLQAARDQDRTALAAAQEAAQRLTVELEASRRRDQEAAQAETRHRAEIKELEAAAAKALEGDSATAEPALRRLLAAKPDDAAALARLGGVLAERGDLSAAEPLLERARRGLPDDPDVLLRLGAVRLRQGQPLAAAAALLQAAVVAPDRAPVHHLLGASFVELGWRDAAEREFVRAFDLDGKRADTAYCLAALLAAAQPPRRQEARLWYDRALALGAARDAGLDGFFTNGK